jgi:hypothetical protein
MKIELEDPCTCRHTASWHENEQSEYTFKEPEGSLFEPLKITRVKLYTKCDYNYDRDAGDYQGCTCLGFQLDNLKYLERKACD